MDLWWLWGGGGGGCGRPRCTPIPTGTDVLSEYVSGSCPQQPSKNKTRNEPIWDCDVFAASFSSQQVPYYFGSYIYVVVNFLSQVIFIFLWFLDMVMYAYEVETKEN